MADLREARGTGPLPRRSKLFQFHAVFGKFWKNRMLAPPGELAPPSSRKSWIRHWLYLFTFKNIFSIRDFSPNYFHLKYFFLLKVLCSFISQSEGLESNVTIYLNQMR